MTDRRTRDAGEKRQATATNTTAGIRTLLVVALLAGAMVLVVSVAAGGAVDANPEPAATLAQDLEDDEHDGERVVVRLEDDFVVTESVADGMPSNPGVQTNESERTVHVEDGQVVTDDGSEVVVGNNTVRTAAVDPNVVVTDGNVVNDSIVVDNSTGLLEAADGNTTVTVDGGPADGEAVEFPEFDRTSFGVEVDEDDIDSVGEGLNLSIPVEVTNTEYGNGTQDLNLSLYDGDDDRVASNVSNVSLERGESTTETLEYETEAGDHVTETIDVFPESGTPARDVPVTINRAETIVEILEPDPPAEGETLSADVEIDRRGNYPQGDHDFLVDFSAGPSEDETELIETEAVNLSPGGDATISFEYDVDADDSPEVFVEAGLREHPTDNETDSRTVPVIGDELIEGNVEAVIEDRNWPEEGEELEIDTLVGYIDEAYIPDESRTFPIEFYVDGDLEESRDVTVDGDSAERETFTYQTESGDAPRVDVDVESPGEGDSARPRINGSGFDVTIAEIDDPVNETETMTAIAQIENTGDASDEQDVRMRIDSAIDDDDRTARDVVDNQTVSLDEGNTTTERFTYRTDEDDVPIVEVAMITDDAEVTRNVTVRDRSPRFEVQQTEATVDDSQSEVDLSAAINNTGLETDEQYVEFLLDGEVVHIDRFSLEPWEERTVAATVDAPETAGSYDFSVVTDNVTESSAGAVTVGDDDPAPETDDEEPEEDDEPEEPEEDDGLPWYLIALGILGVLASTGVFLVYRNDPENFPPDAATVRSQLERTLSKTKAGATTLASQAREGDVAAMAATLKGLFGLGVGTLIVQNELPRDTLVRIRCQTADDTVVLEDLELAPNERRDLGSLPDTDQFKVGAGVEDITAHEEVFQGIRGDVGVVLRADGILIANFD